MPMSKYDQKKVTPENLVTCCNMDPGGLICWSIYLDDETSIAEYQSWEWFREKHPRTRPEIGGKKEKLSYPRFGVLDLLYFLFTICQGHVLVAQIPRIQSLSLFIKL